jgi:hypothetical protein
VVELADSARKHGVRDEDIVHAVRYPMRVVDQGDRYLAIGADRSGRLLEVIVLKDRDDDEDSELVVIHAMPLRRKYYHYLRR